MVFGALSVSWPVCGVQSQGSFPGISPGLRVRRLFVSKACLFGNLGLHPQPLRLLLPAELPESGQCPAVVRAGSFRPGPPPGGPSLLPHRDSWAAHRTHQTPRPFPGNRGPGWASPTAASQEGLRPGTHSPTAGRGLDVGDVPTNPPFSDTPYSPPRDCGLSPGHFPI